MIDERFLEILNQVNPPHTLSFEVLNTFRAIAGDYELYVPFLKNDGVVEFLDALRQSDLALFIGFLKKRDVLFTLDCAGQGDWCKKVLAELPSGCKEPKDYDNWTRANLLSSQIYPALNPSPSPT